MHRIILAKIKQYNKGMYCFSGNKLISAKMHKYERSLTVHVKKTMNESRPFLHNF